MVDHATPGAGQSGAGAGPGSGGEGSGAGSTNGGGQHHHRRHDQSGAGEDWPRPPLRPIRRLRPTRRVKGQRRAGLFDHSGARQPGYPERRGSIRRAGPGLRNDAVGL